MADIWIEETDKAVWHRVRREGPGRLVADCGWHFVPWQGRIWAVRLHEPGPDNAERCHSCVAAQR